VTYRSRADLGGHEGYGAIVRGPEELFHAPWERQALALTLAMGATGTWNLDMGRSARETLPGYGSQSYYQIWVAALEKLLLAHDLVGADEIAAARMLHPARPVARVLAATDVSAALARGAPTQRPAATAARFAAGQSVRTLSEPAPHHTRLPGYARGRTGRIERVHGAHVFPDSNARALGEQPQWLYTVAFTGRELWGVDAPANLVVSIDAWEPYLEAAP
jgi:nitrile hydratase subunit beta